MANNANFRTLAVGAHVSLAGFLYGLDTGSIGPITEMDQFRNSIANLSSGQQGIFVASILLASSVSSLLSGHVADIVSRRYGILIGGLLSLTGTLLSSVSQNFASLIVARLITGFGLGQAIAVTTVYLIEIAPKSIRGVTACMLQTNVVVGITVGYFVSFGSQELQSTLAWRTPFILQACFALVLTIGMFFLPYSPRWLVQKGRIEEARVVLARYRSHEVVEAELEEVQAGLSSHSLEKTAGWLEMFEKRYRGRTMLGIFLMGCQQLTGIDVVLYYAPILFQQAGFDSERASFLASGVSGIVMLVATVPAQIWIDRWGRRKPLIIGGSLMAACFIVIGVIYARYGTRVEKGVRLESRVGQWVVTVLTYVFVANFSWSWAVVGKIYACEIIPTRLRAKVSAVELLTNWLVNFAVALTAPLFLRSSPSGPYFLYGGATLVAAAVCIGMPETKGRSLEEIEFERLDSLEKELKHMRNELRLKHATPTGSSPSIPPNASTEFSTAPQPAQLDVSSTTIKHSSQIVSETIDEVELPSNVILKLIHE
ncbi:sugar transporter [Pseudovirgaria hyperparasitica]|uniref:Sugar transporter n=1 Tax=Pseudovirgaria hyperparasitica TaxID=470096 RepID=A0A6A6VRA6_9PEZI|nr:sugar transporter [Pseudovirgaria hyperparasitica]KAF2752733.1 sugar transporter [Pseudovirgaria hyperparasitica]